MLKKRFAISQGLAGAQSAWDYATQAELDLSAFTTAGVQTQRFGLLSVPPASNGGAVGAIDSYPTTLTAASGNRQIGTGSTPFLTLLGLYVFARTAAGGVYSPANLNLQVDIISAAAAVQGVDNVVASVALSGLTTFWTALTMVAAPASRLASLTGTAPTSNPFYLFNGDVVLVSAIAGAAVDVRTNTLKVVAEFV